RYPLVTGVQTCALPNLLRLADFRQVHHVAQRGNVARELVVVPEHPAQNLASLVLVAAGEFAEVRGKVMQDHARLAKALAAMLERSEERRVGRARGWT